MFAQFGDLSCFLFHSPDQTVQLPLQIISEISLFSLIYLPDQLLVFTVTHTRWDIYTPHSWSLTQSNFDLSTHGMAVTHKLICPSSSWRASRISERLPRLETAVLGEDEGLRRSRWLSEADFCWALTLSHSRRFLCFIMCNTLWTLALTEWLGLVDWKRILISNILQRGCKNIVMKQNICFFKFWCVWLIT